MKHYEEMFSSSHLEDNTIDKSNPKYQLICTIIGVVIMTLIIGGGIFLFKLINKTFDSTMYEINGTNLLLLILAGIVLLIVLPFGIKYLLLKLMIKKELKVKFNNLALNLVVSDTYLYKHTYCIIYLGPFIFILLLLIIPLLFIKDFLIFLSLLILLGIFVGISISEVYPGLIILFKYKKDTLIKDLGKKLIIYKKVNINE